MSRSTNEPLFAGGGKISVFIRDQQFHFARKVLCVLCRIIHQVHLMPECEPSWEQKLHGRNGYCISDCRWTCTAMNYFST